MDNYASSLGYIIGGCVAFALLIFAVATAKFMGRNQNLKPPEE